MQGWRGFALRRVLGRLHVGEDIVRHLATLQRLGAPLEALPPREVLPVAVRTVLRAARTRATVDITPDWLWPLWLEGQLRPDSPAFTPRGHLPVIQNVTRRNWTLVGAPGIAHEAIVDERGLVTPAFDGWSLDWWVGIDGRWHFPSRTDTVRQTLVDDAPIVATSMPVADGEVVQEVFGIATVPGLVVVDVTNRTSRPVEVALAVRPANPESLAVIERIELSGRQVLVEGRPQVELSQPPRRWVVSSYDEGDSAFRLAALDAGRGSGDETAVAASCRAGLAQGAFVLPVEPGERVRAASPLGGRPARARWNLPWRRRHRVHVPRTRSLPSVEQVRSEWERRLDRGMRVRLPDERLQRAVDANRAYLLLLHDPPGTITPGPSTYHRFWFRDAAFQVAALDRWGFHWEAADVLASYPQRQHGDGFFSSQWREWDSNGAAIWALAEHDRLTDDSALRAATLEAVLAGARWIDTACRDDRGKPTSSRGLLPPGISAEHFGPFDTYYWDDFWGWRGLLDAAALARRANRHDEARAAEAAATRLRDTLWSAIERSAAATGERVITAGPERRVDAGMISGLAAAWPLRLLPADDPWIARTAEVIDARFTRGPAFYQEIAHTGLGTYLTLQLAFVELLRGDVGAWRRLEWLMGVATPTYTWPEAVHPVLEGGCMGDGHHGWAAADLLSFVRQSLVHDDAEGLRLLALLPPDWRGRPLRVDDAPTIHGRISYEVEWPDERPMLRWESERPGVRISAPGLAAGWSTLEARGTARLDPGSDQPGGR